MRIFNAFAAAVCAAAICRLRDAASGRGTGSAQDRRPDIRRNPRRLQSRQRLDGGRDLDATGNDGELNIIHVAVAEVQGDSCWIIDATIKHGVDRHPLDTFLTDFTLRDGSYPVFKVMRLRDDSRAQEFVDNTRKFLGQPYDSAFLPDNGAMYCSELVYESYLTPDGGHIFSEAPMNFLDDEGAMPVYWEQLFGMLGMEVPQGIPGTNPRQMSRDPALVNVELDFPVE